VISWDSGFRSQARTFHSLLTLVLAWAGGRTARYFYAHREKVDHG
jgi:hypothetical protein